VIALIHLFHTVLDERWCHHDCVGPLLFWNNDGFFDDSNSKFRKTFSLAPSPLGENFGPLIAALFSLTYLQDEQEGVWFYGWWLFVTLFACLPFAGGGGIVVGFAILAMLVSALCLPQIRTRKITLSMPFAFTARGGRTETFNSLFRGLQICASVLVVLTVINNVIFVGHSKMHKWCHTEIHDCVTSWLIWPKRSVWDNVNGPIAWGSVFSLDISVLLEIWAPTFLVVAYYAKGKTLDLGLGFFLLFLAIFGAFGYGGNFGILLGFALVLLAIPVLLLTLFPASGSESRVVGLYDPLLPASETSLT